MHCSHLLGRLLSSLMAWNEPSRLSPACILYEQTNKVSQNNFVFLNINCCEWRKTKKLEKTNL